MKTYFEQYNSLPSKEALAIIVSNDKQINERDFEFIKETLKEIADEPRKSFVSGKPLNAIPAITIRRSLRASPKK